MLVIIITPPPVTTGFADELEVIRLELDLLTDELERLELEIITGVSDEDLTTELLETTTGGITTGSGVITTLEL